MYARFSPGTYTILKQWQHCVAEGIPYLYLGLYVAESAHLSYKANFVPHERRIEGVWTRFERAPDVPAARSSPTTRSGAGARWRGGCGTLARLFRRRPPASGPRTPT